MKRVYVWDPNPFNPYGAEVARVVQDSGAEVNLVCRRGLDRVSSDSHRRAWLPPPGNGARTMRNRLVYLAACIRVTLRAMLRREVLIVPWVGTPLEYVLFLLVAFVGRSDVVVVDHNPIPERKHPHWAGLVGALNRRATRRVVHTQALADGIFDGGQVAVAAHPSYADWAKRFAQTSPASSRSSKDGGQSGDISVLYLGGVRADKGFSDLPSIAREAAKQGVALIVAIGRATQDVRQTLQALDGNPRVVAEMGHLTDEQVAALLLESDFLIAPYTQVTASGTVLMALTCDREVIAYRSSAYGDLVTDDLMVEVGDAAALIQTTRRTTAGLTSPASRAMRQDDQSKRDWAAILDGLREGGRAK